MKQTNQSIMFHGRLTLEGNFWGPIKEMGISSLLSILLLIIVFYPNGG
jgi:predicted DNA-binding ribbon-helix-helix protein